MGSRREATISGFNEYVDELEDKKDGEILLSLIQFDTRIENKFLNRRIEDIDALTEEDFIPGGMTALLDGVGQAIRTAELSSGKDDKVLVVIMTDGGENSSREYRHDAILKAISEKRKDGWEFLFMGAGEEAWGAGQQLFSSVIPMHTHSINYSGLDAHDHKHGYAALANSTLRSAGGQSAAFDSGVKSRLENKALAEVGKK